MSLTIHVGEAAFEIGSPSFLRSFYSTVFVRLEKHSWGSRFPTIMKELYAGELVAASAGAAVAELATIAGELRELEPTEVVWNHEDLSQTPPWGSNIAPSITNMSEYFVTSDGRPLLDVLDAAFGEAARTGRPVCLC